jgi:hypothetical protein
MLHQPQLGRRLSHLIETARGASTKITPRMIGQKTQPDTSRFKFLKVSIPGLRSKEPLFNLRG